MIRCAVVGAGAWGTALADLLARNGHDVRLWAHEQDVVAERERAARQRSLSRRRARSTRALRATGDLAERASTGAELVTYVTPSHVLRRVVAGTRRASRRDAIWWSPPRASSSRRWT